MKLNEVDFYIDWPGSIEVKNLRKYLIANLEKQGDLIRWSIVDIKNSADSYDTKKLRIRAVLAN